MTVRLAGDDDGSRNALRKHPPFVSKTQMIAKFYDPLYYDHDQTGDDVFKLIDSTYPTEASAYTTVSKVRGPIIPHCYGSFTRSFPVMGGEAEAEAIDEDNKEEKTMEELLRCVGSILIEDIPGRKLYSLKARSLDVAQRQGILGAVICTEFWELAKWQICLCWIPGLLLIVAGLATQSFLVNGTAPGELPETQLLLHTTSASTNFNTETAVFTEAIRLNDIMHRNTAIPLQQSPNTVANGEHKRIVLQLCR